MQTIIRSHAFNAEFVKKYKLVECKKQQYCDVLNSSSLLEYLYSNDNINSNLNSFVDKINLGADRVKNKKYFENKNKGTTVTVSQLDQICVLNLTGGENLI